MAHSHYVMDLCCSPNDRPDNYRRAVLRIHGDEDTEALAEAKRVGHRKNTAFYHLRAILTSARSGDRFVHDSGGEVAPVENAAIGWQLP